MKFAIAFLAAAALCYAHPAPAQLNLSLESKLLAGGSADVMVVMKESVGPVVASINARRFTNSAAKTTELVAQLRAFTKASQEPVLNFLNKKILTDNIKFKPMWITNKVSVNKATLGLLKELLSDAGHVIAEIREAKVIYLSDSKPEPAPEPRVLEWGVDNIDADLLWPTGIDGTGVVVSSIDTGVRATHVALRDSKRESYFWFDGSTLGSAVPDDIEGHGTHTMGTIAGTGGTGVAPGSKWIHCRAFEAGQATEEALTVCGQWIACPTLPDGSEEDCSQKPNVCSNSWGGGNADAFYNDIIDIWQAASIVPVFAIGNSGPGCRSANSPGDQPNVISVGATNAQNIITSFSSHGPAQVSLKIKPEVSAPGNNIRSAGFRGDNLYSVLSGTSMACPHVAGAVALLLQKNPTATFQQIEKALEETALRPEIGEIICTGGGVNQTYPWPNNSHGFGKINVNAASASI